MDNLLESRFKRRNMGNSSWINELRRNPKGVRFERLARIMRQLLRRASSTGYQSPGL